MRDSGRIAILIFSILFVLPSAYAQPELDCREGTVDLGGSGHPAAVLSINGSSGDASHVVTVPMFHAIWGHMDVPPAGPNPAKFALYVWLGEPTAATVTPHPFKPGEPRGDQLFNRTRPMLEQETVGPATPQVAPDTIWIPVNPVRRVSSVPLDRTVLAQEKGHLPRTESQVSLHRVGPDRRVPRTYPFNLKGSGSPRGFSADHLPLDPAGRSR